jgi:NADPH2:quinone reductase
MNAQDGAGPTRTAQAVGITGPGGYDCLAVVTRQVRAPRPGEVLIAVQAATVNPTDLILRRAGIGGVSKPGGAFVSGPHSAGAKASFDPALPPPWTPGMEAAGLVEAVGEGVEGLAVGDRVMTVVAPRRPEGGAQASLLIAPAASTVRIPDGVSIEAAAAIPMNGLTALLGLELLGLSPGDTLAVSGGAGMLSSYVIPIAKRFGLVVLADARAEEEALVRGFGADIVVPRSDDFAGAVRAVRTGGVDGLFDTALLLDAALGAIRDGGAMATVRGWEPDQASRGIRVTPVWVVKALERTDWLHQLRSLVADGTITPRIAARFAPEQIADAHRRVDAGGLRGRIVITF